MSGSIWIQIAQFVAALSLLIVLHEGGHFFFARLFKTRVEKFYLFFDFLFPFAGLLNFSLFKKKVGDTEYGLGWFPLGGYVKIAGMVDESADKDQLAGPPQPWEYRSKPAWQRLFIMLGGIIVNVLLALIIYSMIMFIYGEKRLPMSELKGGVMVVDSLGYKLGFQDGDKILSINNKPVRYFDELHAELLYAQTVKIERNGAQQDLAIPVNFIEQLIDGNSKGVFYYPLPSVVGKIVDGSNAEKAGLKSNDRITAVNGMAVPYFHQLQSVLESLKGQQVTLGVTRADGSVATMPAQVTDTGTLGFQIASLEAKDMEKLGVYKYDTKKYGLLEAIPAGTRYAWGKLTFYTKQFTLIFNPKTGAYKGVGGFASMTKVFPDYWDWEAFWRITAFLSLVLAFMNLLPIPGLDGGYVMFLLIEMITRRKVPDRVLEIANTIGLVLLLALMLYANGNDIFKAFK